MRESAKNLFILVILEVLTVFEAAKAILQATGVLHSNNVVFAITGSFRNPGPLGGFIAMGMSAACAYLAINRRWNNLNFNRKLIYLLSVATFSLGVIILPATMSRAGWLAFGVAAIILAFKELKLGKWLMSHKTVKSFSAIIVLSLCLLAFKLKPDSALGRIHIWHMECRSIAEKPWTGHGNVLGAYGATQARYFMEKERSETIVQLAGSPEYAFNEYLQAAVELGIPLAVCLLVVVVLCLYRGVRKGRYGICGAILSLMIFSFSSYPLQLPVFIVTFGGLLVACLSGADRWQWLGLAVSVGIIGGFRLKNDLQVEQACREWMNARVLYNAGAYQSAEKEYGRLYPLLRDRASFLFEYGHGLHKQQQFSKSNRILKEALQRSCDPMILNVIGKNYQQMGDCLSAEDWFIRSTHRLPGRIYPYYLLAKLYAEPSFRQPDKFEKMKWMVLTKEPKVHSTAIRQMREEIKKIQLIFVHIKKDE